MRWRMLGFVRASSLVELMRAGSVLRSRFLFYGRDRLDYYLKSGGGGNPVFFFREEWSALASTGRERFWWWGGPPFSPFPFPKPSAPRSETRGCPLLIARGKRKCRRGSRGPVSAAYCVRDRVGEKFGPGEEASPSGPPDVYILWVVPGGTRFRVSARVGYRVVLAGRSPA